MNILNNLKIGIKLSLSYLIMFLVMTVLAYNGYSSARIIEDKLEDVLHVRLAITNLLLNSDRDFQQLLVAERTLLSSDAKSDLFKSLLNDYEENLAQAKERTEKAFLLLTTPAEKELADRFRNDMAAWEKESRKVLAACQTNSEKSKAEAISVSLGQAAVAFEKSRDHLDKLNDLNDAIIAETEKQATEAYSKIVSGIMILLFIAMCVALFLGFGISRGITIPISQGVLLAEEISRGIFSRRLNLKNRDEIGQLGLSLDLMADNLAKNAKIADEIAEGNLNVEVKLASEHDQLGLALKKMAETLNDVLGQVKSASEQIAASSSEVSAASQSLSGGATEQASSLEEISSSITEIGSQTRQNAENAQQASQLSADARIAAESGDNQMKAMMTAMDEIVNSQGN